MRRLVLSLVRVKTVMREMSIEMICVSNSSFVFFSLLVCCSGWILVALVHILLLLLFWVKKLCGCMLFPLYPSLLYQRGLLEKKKSISK